VRDESLHCEGIVKLYHAFRKETNCVTKQVADDIIDNCKTVVTMEDRFIDLAFEMGPIEGMTPDDIKQYIRFVADWRLRQLELPEVYGVKENPLPWLQVLLSGVEHANFFEARATEYSKAATRGRWDGNEGVWASFDAMMAKRTTESAPH
jgi:ribonucleoside-diphosphate reductase beta chain